MFKIRASGCGNIMGTKALGKTGETYCKNYIQSKIYLRRKEFTSKYTDKGIVVEDNSIDFISDYLGYGMLVKNDERFENEYMTGEPDVITKTHLIDVKNSWDCFTFPFFETEVKNKDYYWQAQVYMELTGLAAYKLIYVLSDNPIHLIEKEAYYWCKNNGYDELDSDIYQQFLDKMTYSDIPDKYKIKVFNIKRNNADIDKIKERVIECRNYIKTSTTAVNVTLK